MRKNGGMLAGWIPSVTGFSLALLMLGGCAQIGPAAISHGRGAYNEVIAKTDDDQSLAFIVRLRYGETANLLTVASITANVRFSANAGAQFGIGPDENFAGNLVPLSGGIAYEENPTISYLPVRGDKHLRQILSPIPLEYLALLYNVALNPGSMLVILASRINQAANPDFATASQTVEEQRFARMVDLVNELGTKLQFVQRQEKSAEFYLWIHDYAPARTGEIVELLDILGIKDVVANGDDIFLPVSLTPRPANEQSVAIQTRSVFSLARLAAANIDVPEEDRKKGLVFPYPAPGLSGELIRIRRAKERPADALVAIPYRGWWFYIDGADNTSKLFFAVFQALMLVRIAEATKDSQAAPVLTVPVN